jgi:two-component system sensor histidine kinase DegS
MSNSLIALREIQAESEREGAQLETELRELNILIVQTNGEIERLTPRQQESQARLRQLEANLDAFSPAEIQATYSVAQEIQARLFMAKSQLDSFQSKQRYLERYIQQLRRLSELISQIVESAGTPGEPGAPVKREAVSDQQAILHIIEAQESERQHLARQMHDGPAQSLTNLVLQAEIVERLFDTDASRARSELGNLKTAANATFQRIRDFIFDLRPMMLDDLGLVPTLRRYVQNFEAKNRLHVNLLITGDRPLGSPIEITLFRSVQELLQNVAAHAHATHAQVTVDIKSDPVVAIVEDDGSGFDVSQVLARAREHGTSGLARLDKRLEMLNGKLQITSGTGRGTRARIELPASSAVG